MLSFGSRPRSPEMAGRTARAKSSWVGLTCRRASNDCAVRPTGKSAGIASGYGMIVVVGPPVAQRTRLRLGLGA